jgi:hypothetical protein
MFNLKQHQRAIHDHIRPFLCDVCHLSFAYRHVLDAHKLTHAKALTDGEGRSKRPSKRKLEADDVAARAAQIRRIVGFGCGLSAVVQGDGDAALGGVDFSDGESGGGVASDAFAAALIDDENLPRACTPKATAQELDSPPEAVAAVGMLGFCEIESLKGGGIFVGGEAVLVKGGD